MQGGDVPDAEWLLHSSEHPALDYMAQEERPEGGSSLLKHFVGLFDPQTGQELRNNLGSTFGTKKARKAIAALTENAISSKRSTDRNEPSSQSTIPLRSDPLNAAVLDSMAISTSQMATREQLQTASDEVKPRPRANLEAEQLSDVYPIEVLVGLDEMKSLSVKEWEDAARTNTAIAISSRYVSRRVQRIASKGDVKMLKVLRYLLLLIDFFSALKRVGKDGKKLPQRDDLRTALDAPDHLIDGIRRRFADGGKINLWRVDNLITHMAALTLLVDDYNVDINDLRDDLKLTSKRMTTYYREIGCTITALSDIEMRASGLSKSQASSHKAARLRLPLTFPKIRIAAQRRK
ncbi:MAG: DNA-directed RNA polymerase I subunit rpa49 [Thelocarpon superellum]|nr:MAG: DNA-directed RNA polymerase I subunit rpa49 [Thelocarpon superellum]